MMPRELTNQQIGELHAALSLLSRDGKRANPELPAQIKGDLTYPPLAIRAARAVQDLKPAKRAVEHAINAKLDQYRRDNKLPEDVIIPDQLVQQLIEPIMCESQQLPDIKPITGQMLKKAGVQLDAGIILALDFMLEGYDEDLFEPKEEVVEDGS